MSQQGSGSNARVGTHWFGSLGKLHTSRERRGGIDFLSNLRLRRSAFHTGSGCRIPSSHVRLGPLRMTLSATRATTCEVRRSYVRHFSRHFSGNPPTIECLKHTAVTAQRNERESDSGSYESGGHRGRVQRVLVQNRL